MKNRVKELRLEQGITQQELADKVSVSSRTIISLEKEKYNPSVLLAYKIASVLIYQLKKRLFLMKMTNNIFRKYAHMKQIMEEYNCLVYYLFLG